MCMPYYVSLSIKRVSRLTLHESWKVPLLPKKLPFTIEAAVESTKEGNSTATAASYD